MKRLFVLLALIATPAFAANPFVGKYQPDAANCDYSGLGVADRVYISFGKSFADKNVSALLIQSYGDDASAVEILLGSGSRRMPGTSPEYHGQVTQSWKTSVLTNRLKSVEVVTKGRYEARTTHTLLAERDVLELRTVEIVNGKKTSEESCRLIRK